MDWLKSWIHKDQSSNKFTQREWMLIGLSLGFGLGMGYWWGRSSQPHPMIGAVTPWIQTLDSIQTLIQPLLRSTQKRG